MIKKVSLLLSLAFAFGTLAFPVAAQKGSDANDTDAVKLAAEVTIYRDVYGVPHVFGKTDASTAFGFGYAQAEDNFWQIEDNYIRSLGRSAEVYGQATFEQDKLNHALEIPRLAREEYERLDPQMRTLCDAYTAGINYFLTKHSETKTRLLAKIVPWYPLAFIKYNYYQNGFSQDPVFREPSVTRAEYSAEQRTNQGSNGWVIGPSKSATGHPLLFINPHLPFFGSGQVYEGHIHSDQGWNFTGYARLGFPFPYIGHNENCGWVSTDNAADLEDVYAETFDDPTDPLAYRYGAGHRIAEERVEEIKVKTANGIETRRIAFRKTHHGPILASKDGKSLAIRMARYGEDGWLREWFDMTRANSLAAFKKAIEPLKMLFGNIMYADRQGNTFYVYNGAIPIRDPKFDWQKPLDGSDPATEWKGYHKLSELPQLTNPPSGWMQNCNTTPFLLTDKGNLDPKDFPRYMVQEGDNRRGRAARRILSGQDKFTFDDWRRAAFDTHVIGADQLLPTLLASLKAYFEHSPDTELKAAYDLLSGWDRRSTIDSEAMTIFHNYRSAFEDDSNIAIPNGQDRSIAALRSALAEMKSEFGSWRVKWGDVVRLQRPDESTGLRFSDALQSIAVPAVPGNDGAVFTIYPRPEAGQKRVYGTAGATYISIVEFGSTVRAESVHVFGSSGHPESKHFMDQSPLYARGEFKPAWFTLDEIKAHLEKSYHPGQ